MPEEIIQRGAEAIILRKNNSVLKYRVKKSYRIPELDEKIRKLRTRSEGKLLEKASKIISIPSVIKIDEKTKKIFMEFISGKKLSDNLDFLPLKRQKEISKIIGTNISKIHDGDIIHGDLTTSNMILSERENKVYFIDFGLGFMSTKIEDRAVDLHLLKQALEAKHFNNWKELFKEITKGYSKSENSKKVLEQLKKVESRGRYKDKY